MRNKVTTLSYFVKRLRDNGYHVNKIFNKYPNHDCRKWTVMVNPEVHSCFITCFMNVNFHGDVMFEFSAGTLCPRGFQLNTDSMEVVINYLARYKIDPVYEAKKTN